MDTPAPPPRAAARLRHPRAADVLFAWSPLIGLLLLCALVALLLSAVVNCGWLRLGERCVPHVPAVFRIERPWEPYAELRDRLVWSVTVLFFAVTVVMTLVMSARVIWQTVRIGRRVAAAVVVLIAAAATAYHLGPAGQSLPWNARFLDDTVYASTGAEVFVDVMEGMAVLTLVVLAVATSGILSRAVRARARRPPMSLRMQASALAGYQHGLRTLLYVAAIALVAGTLESSALYTWGVGMLRPDEMPLPGGTALEYFTATDNIPQTMAAINGALYSLLLATIFAPAFVQLRSWAEQLAREAQPDASAADRRKWLEEHAIAGSLPKQLVTAFAMLAPMLAGGPLPALLERISG